MRILLTGVSGQVGRACHLRLSSMAGVEVITRTRKQCDFSVPAKVFEQVCAIKPDIVINPCAYTAVDLAESEQSLADTVNHLSVTSLAKACTVLDIPLIHFSTDYVFDGTQKTPYHEASPVSPLGIYGRSKWLGEQAIEQAMAKFIILRTSWVFSEYGHNFVRTMLRLGQGRESLSVVVDQVGRPTYAGHIAVVVERFLQCYLHQGVMPWGVYHCCSQGETSWYHFAQAIFALARKKHIPLVLNQLLETSSAEYPTVAPRPLYSVLNTQKLEAWLGEGLPSWETGLEDCFRALQA